ncbi:hypothetical protein [Mariprofundus ferrooxydans]|uniref:hypothetical protein n=1 Tax=Mariprofundus ferrooxydans TaxID=314344 RepID=UPI001364C627|nr:hypothetical protein [Mariprofundus ferrooxydans]
MVALKNISAYSAPPPKVGGGKIGSGPLYMLADVKTAVGKGEGVNLWTRGCVEDVRSLGLDDRGVSILICKLSSDDYRDSEWCCSGNNNIIAACDSYVLKTREFCEAAMKHMDVEYFMKFALKKNGDLVIVASCHLSS